MLILNEHTIVKNNMGINRKSKHSIRLAITAIITIFPFFVYSQQKPKTKGYRFGDHWLVNVKTGSSILLTEFDDGLKSFRNEMKNRPGVSASVSFSKLASKHWEVGYEYEQSRFSGFNDNPDFPAIVYHELISKMDIEPIVYHSKSHNHGINLIYHFQNIGTLSGGTSPINFFTEIKAGLSLVECELSYKNNIQDRYPVIFAKRSFKNITLKNSSLYIGSWQFGAGVGLRYHLNDRTQFVLLNDYTFVNDDLIDAVHNYIVAGNRAISNRTNGLYTRIIAGVSYSFNWQLFQNKKSNFYLSKYKSSRYSPTPSHKIKKERDIWYRKK